MSMLSNADIERGLFCYKGKKVEVIALDGGGKSTIGDGEGYSQVSDGDLETCVRANEPCEPNECKIIRGAMPIRV